MRRLLALLILCAPAVHAATIQCPDGTYVDSADYPADCGANVTGLNASTIGATSLTFSASTDVSSGTAYLSVTLSSTPPHWDSVRDGTLDECSANAAVSSGTLSVQCTGLTSAVTYCGHVTQLVNGIPSIVDTSCVSTSPPPPTGGGDGVEITAAARFAGTGGSDASSGLAHATRWLNPPSTNLPASVDMWFFDATSYTNKKLLIDWAGTPSDYVRVGTYCMDGSTPREYPHSTCAKATFAGGVNPNLVATGQNNFSASAQTASGLGGTYDSHVRTAAGGDYSEVQDLILQGSLGIGYLAQGNGTVGSLHHHIVRDMEIYNAAFTGLAVIDGPQDIVVKNNIVDLNGVCYGQLIKSWQGTAVGPLGECTSHYFGAGIVVAGRHGTAHVIRALIENNTVTRGTGEGIDFIRGRYGIYRGNRIGNQWSSAIYPDQATDVVVENNIVWGSKGDVGSASGAVIARWTEVSFASEDFQLPNVILNQTGHVMRNNLMVDLGTCLELGIESASITAGVNSGIRYYHNTCIAPRFQAIQYEFASGSVVSLHDNQNNVYWSESLSAANICLMPVSTNVTFVDNKWFTNPSQANCDGAGDEYSTPGIGVISYAAWDAFTHSDKPEFTDAAPQGSATATKLTTAVLDKDLFGFAYEQMTDVLNSTISESNWECQACLTATNLVRNATTHKGAMGQ